MSITSILARPGIDLVGLDAGTLRDIFIEMFRPRTAIDNRLLNNACHGGRKSFIRMKENLMAPLVFAPKMKMMEQKAFWMHMKIFSTFMMNKKKLGSSVTFKAADLEMAKKRDGKQRPRQRPWWKKILPSTISRNMAKKSGFGKRETSEPA